MLQTFYKHNKTMVNKILFIAGFTLFIYLFINVIYGFIAPFVIAYIISLALEPLVKLMNRGLKIGRGFGALIVLILLALGLIFAGINLVSRITYEIQKIQNDFPGYAESIKNTFDDLNDSISQNLPEELSVFTDSALDSIISALSGFLGNLVKDSSITVVSQLPLLLTNIILFLLATFFFIKDKYKIARSVKSAAPSWISDNFSTVRSGFLKAFLGYVKAQAIIMSVTTTVSILGLTILRNPYALLIGLAIGLVDALPIFGSGAIIWPWALFCLITKSYSLAVGLMILYGVVFLTRQFLEPKVLSEQIGVHPLITLMSIYAGLKFFGPIGLFAGPIIVVTAKIIMEMPTAGKAEATEAAGESLDVPDIPAVPDIGGSSDTAEPPLA